MQLLQRPCNISLCFAEVILCHEVDVFVEYDAERIAQVVMLAAPYQQTLAIFIFPEIRLLVLIQRIHAVMGVDICI